jgi:hypothetical protein
LRVLRRQIAADLGSGMNFYCYFIYLLKANTDELKANSPEEYEIESLGTFIEELKMKFAKDKELEKVNVEPEEKQFEISPPASPQHDSIFKERSRRTTHTKSQLNNIDPIQHFYDQAYQSIEKLIMIRSSWDSFIVTDNSGSSIPQSFLDPPIPSSTEWQKYLVT